MKKVALFIAIALVLYCMNFYACSKSEDGASTKGKIEEMTDHAAEVAVDGIKAPINKARKLQGLAQDRLKSLDEPPDEQ